jgi:hypothetical protein
MWRAAAGSPTLMQPEAERRAATPVRVRVIGSVRIWR